MGKSALALRLAERFGADIVSADSRQVYRYMDVGTAKPSRTEQARIRHWMIDLVEPCDTYTVSRYRAEAERVLKRLEAAKKPGIVVGGTGFYIRALLDGLRLPPVPPDPALRQRLRDEVTARGTTELWQRLERVDPSSAARVHPNNVPRLIRALEVVEKLGGPVLTRHHSKPRDALYIGLSMDRPRLHDVTNRRVASQVEAGLVEETRQLLAMGYDPASPALDGFGYREMVAHLQGLWSLDQAVEAYRASTRRYIRRQMTWFRADARINWFDVERAPEPTIVAMIQRWLEG